MRRRRLLAALTMALVVAAVIGLDVRILTMPSLVRIRVEQALVKVFHHAGTFRHPRAGLDGTIRAEDFHLVPPGHSYSISAEEIAATLDLAGVALGRVPTRTVSLRHGTIRWRHDPGGTWDGTPLSTFCKSLSSSPITSVEIDDLTLVLGSEGGGEPGGFHLDRVQAEVTKQGVRFRGSSRHHPPWDLLRFDLLVGDEITGTVHVEKLRIRPQDTWLLPSPVARVIQRLRPRGTADASVLIRGGGEWQLRIQPIHLSLRPVSFPYPLRKITSGSITVDPSGFRLDQIRGGAGLEVSGRFPLPGEEGDQSLQVAWGETDLDETLAAAMPEGLAWVWSLTRPSGRTRGRVAVQPPRGRFGLVRGELQLDPLRLALPVPVSFRGGAKVREEDGELRVSLDRIAVEASHLALGEVEAGEIVISEERLRLPRVMGGSPDGSFRGAFARSRDWPSRWAGSLSLDRRDLGEVLLQLTGREAPSGGDWVVWIAARGGEGRSSGSGAAWLSSPLGRQMPILGAVFPPGPGRVPWVRGVLSFEVERDSVRITGLVLESGDERAVGEGEVLGGERIRFRIIRTSPGGPIGPSSVGLPAEVRPAVIFIEGAAGAPEVRVEALP